MPGWLTFAQQASLPVFAVAALLLALVAFIKAWPALRQLQIEGDASLRTTLMTRVSELEARVRELEKLISQKEASHAAKEQFLRHQFANESATLDAFILLAESNPDRIFEHIPRIKEMREAGRQRVAIEKGAAAGAAIAATGGEL